MAQPYSQDLRHRVIDAVIRGEMSRRAAARGSRERAWRSNGSSGSSGMVREGESGTAASGVQTEPHRAFLEAARAEKSDVTLKALCDRFRPSAGLRPTPR